MKIAVLDDYQKVAPGLADWSSLTGATVTFFSDHLDDPAGLVSRLADFDAVVVTRERTGVPGRTPGAAAAAAAAGHAGDA